MKIIFEHTELQEAEVIIKGRSGSEEVTDLLRLLGKQHSGKLFLYKEDEQFVIDNNEIVFAEVIENKINVYTERDLFYSKLKLYELKEQLSSLRFVQINKSTIINIDFVKSIQAEFSGNYSIKLKNRNDILTISRKYFKDFKNSI